MLDSKINHILVYKTMNQISVHLKNGNVKYYSLDNLNSYKNTPLLSKIEKDDYIILVYSCESFFYEPKVTTFERAEDKIKKLTLDK